MLPAGCALLQWRQGSVLTPHDFSEFPEIAPLSLDEHDLLIVASQSCDAVCPSLDDEPDVDVIVARRIESVDGSNTFGKNPRKYDFEWSGSAYRCLMREKLSLKRIACQDKAPSSQLPLDVVEDIARWLARRYDRSAFPDAFNERRKGMKEKMRKGAKKGVTFLSGIYIALSPRDRELSEGESYAAILLFTVPVDVANDRDRLESAVSAATAIQSALRACPGIDLPDDVVDVRSEADVSLAERRMVQRLDVDFDDLTMRFGGPAAVPA